jgi:serine/threonine-protein kinase ATR
MNLGLILLDHTASILAKIFLQPHRTDDCLRFLVDLLRTLTKGQTTTEISTSSLMTTCIVPFIVSLTVELGDEDKTVAAQATQALIRAQREQVRGGKREETDLGVFLKPHMLGIISHLNETLHDMQGRKSVAFKRKVIRSLGALVREVGDSMSSFSPQVSR